MDINDRIENTNKKLDEINKKLEKLCEEFKSYILPSSVFFERK